MQFYLCHFWSNYFYVCWVPIHKINKIQLSACRTMSISTRAISSIFIPISQSVGKVSRPQTTFAINIQVTTMGNEYWHVSWRWKSVDAKRFNLLILSLYGRPRVRIVTIVSGKPWMERLYASQRLVGGILNIAFISIHLLVHTAGTML